MRGGDQGKLQEMNFELSTKINISIPQMEKNESSLQEKLTDAWKYGVFKEFEQL